MTDTDLYKDLLEDSKNQRHFFMGLVVVLVVLLALSTGRTFHEIDEDIPVETDEPKEGIPVAEAVEDGILR